MMLAAPLGSETLAPFASALPPAALMSFTISCAGERSAPSPSALPPRSLTTTDAPSLAHSSAISRPTPRPAPVTAPTRSLKDRKSVVEGKSVSVRVDLGGRRSIKTKTYILHLYMFYTFTQYPRDI